MLIPNIPHMYGAQLRALSPAEPNDVWMNPSVLSDRRLTLAVETVC